MSSRQIFHIIFRQIVLEAAQIWQELAPHCFPTDCFEGSSNLVGTGSTLFSGRLFWDRFLLDLIKNFFWHSFKVQIDVLLFLPRVQLTRNHPIFMRI